MDKKTNLTPELKEIYDRVMNTSTTPQKAISSATPEPLQSNSPSPANQSPVSNNIPSQTLTTPSVAQPVTPPPTINPVMPPINESASSIPAINGTAEEALTNTPARPLTEGNTFSFSGTATADPTASNPQNQSSKTPKGKFSLSLPILLILGFVFIVVWGIFWAIILGIIKR